MDFQSLNFTIKNHIVHRRFKESQEPEQKNNYRVVVVGAAAIGKSSLIHRFIDNTFHERHIPTVEDVYCQVRKYILLNLIKG